jgi:hypothetical protein
MTPPELKVEMARKDGELRVDYSVFNREPTPVYLVTVLWQYARTGAIELDPRAAYVSVSSDNVLRIGKMMHPTPKTRLVEQTIVPFARRLDGGGAWKDAFSLPIPVSEYNPYFPEESAQWVEREAASAELWVGWIAEGESLQVHRTPFDPAVRLQHPRLLPSIQTVKSAAVRLRVPVKIRQDRFERF